MDAWEDPNNNGNDEIRASKAYKGSDLYQRNFTERIDDTMTMVPDANAYTEDSAQLETIPQEYLEELRFKLSRINYCMNSAEIADILQILEQIDSKFLSESDIRNIVQCLPNITALAPHQNIFELLNRISSDPEKALILSELDYVQQINFSQFPDISDEYKILVSQTVLYMLRCNPDNAEIFYQSFFPVFIPYFTGPSLYKSPSLAMHLNVAEAFIPMVHKNESEILLNIFRTFFTFAYRTTSECLLADLHGICTCIYTVPDFLQEIKDEQFLNQLKYLATRRCVTDDRDSREVRQYALVVFEYIASFTNVKCHESAYRVIGELLMENLDQSQSEVCSEAIFLLGFAVANQYFLTTVDYFPIIQRFFDLFENLSVSDQKEWIQSFANILYFVPPMNLEDLVTKDQFFELLDDCLTYDESSVQERFITALHRILLSSNTLAHAILEHPEIIDDLNDLASMDSSVIRTRIEAIMNIIKKAEQE
ncbi:hypothetical protein TVAG_196330 [Trichomonas vaginalis G3]|uniref:26S proteasome non-ATPase regulatory subunit 5 n=1 Tax=Trichomonas vaginalis (strain ATCC PRA-98 / G3) TaxID=412133 RepID=A2F4W5_TRIV3|nr:armadillo (ARM) repeat-containing protein family [Trichomonas vaginalis G3]EAY00073.1 hypothetical protein TVAG_196330 [Trichomonas vaginalis G3]KAI5543734.1 armadillo (ARM) repeat-containing protein family [Trichomonas vaginalis G3]|eukprot:XP_001313002.1 hypothetical protein [Trichomonas vaginalis G3]